MSRVAETGAMGRAIVRLPSPLRPLAGGRAEVPVSGTTVGAVVEELAATYPALRSQLLTNDGRLRKFVNVYLNDRDVRELAADATPVRDSDVLSIVPSVGG